MTYDEAVEYILNIPKFTSKNEPSHTREFMKRLGNPQDCFQVIHVAGSNGKGSVCAFINNVCLENGLHVGLFTSPHLTHIRERFLIDGVPCDKSQFLSAMNRVQTVVDDMKEEGLSHPTFFEYIFAMGMVIFADAHVECAIVETGLGGRLDATNVIEHPLLTVITSISLEHTEILGNTIEEIAKEKAGIIKPGVPVIYDGNEPEAENVILQVSKEKNAPSIKVSKEAIKILLKTGKIIDFSLDSKYDVTKVRISIPAMYQVGNAALALAAVNKMRERFPMCPEKIKTGFKKTEWPGRMEEIYPDIYLDGAHNVSGIKAFLEAVEGIGGKEDILLFSMVKEKDYREAIRLLCKEGNFQKIILTKISNNPRALELSCLERCFKEEIKQNTKLLVIEEAEEAFTYAKQIKRTGQNVFCAGSLYLIGELKQIVGGKEND